MLGRGLLNHLFTRIDFDDEDANASAPMLAHVPAERRATLVATRDGSASGPVLVYRFDVILQGTGETVEAPGGARPSYAHGYYDRDNAFYLAWDAISRDRDRFTQWMRERVLLVPPSVEAVA